MTQTPKPITADEALRREMLRGSLYRIITRGRRAGRKLHHGPVHAVKSRLRDRRR